jgi:site-specific recombinase XerC
MTMTGRASAPIHQGQTGMAKAATQAETRSAKILAKAFFAAAEATAEPQRATVTNLAIVQIREKLAAVEAKARGKPEDLSHALPKALVKIGLADDMNVHGLRKLAAAELADAGCSMHEIAAITGHRSLSMVQLYTRSADQERLASAAIVRLSERKDKRAKKANNN